MPPKPSRKLFADGRRPVPDVPADLSPNTIPAPKPDGPERLSFAVRSDGTIALDQLRPGTRDKIRKALADPAARAAILETGTPAKPSADDIALCGVLYDAIGSILVSVFRASGYPVEQAEMMRYSQQEKTVLLDPTARVFAKYVTDFKYMDELMLGVLLTTITSTKVAAIKKPATVITFPQASPDLPPA